MSFLWSLAYATGFNEGTLRTEREHWEGSEALHMDIMNASRGNVRSSRPQQFDSIWQHFKIPSVAVSSLLKKEKKKETCWSLRVPKPKFVMHFQLHTLLYLASSSKDNAASRPHHEEFNICFQTSLRSFSEINEKVKHLYTFSLPRAH